MEVYGRRRTEMELTGQNCKILSGEGSDTFLPFLSRNSSIKHDDNDIRTRVF